MQRCVYIDVFGWQYSSSHHDDDDDDDDDDDEDDDVFTYKSDLGPGARRKLLWPTKVSRDLVGMTPKMY
eukprot:7897326-Karenia_brevis.AAC.1